MEAELSRVKYRQRYRGVLKSTVYTLITVAAVAVLVATLWLPVLQTYGSSMTPTLRDGEIVFSLKTSDLEQGDIIAFYYNNKILVKWVIAGPGDWVDISPEDGKVFVMGDHRATSVDSRHTAVGCVAEEQVVGKIVFRVWPLDRFGGF